ncbi:hypothetical protein J4405_00965 [Candidatus Woesearchaeota archaeon]|nr:hypothetical protein [Candidatus Woesearchaeota archaeon]
MRDVEGIAERMFLGRVATRFIETFPDSDLFFVVEQDSNRLVQAIERERILHRPALHDVVDFNAFCNKTSSEIGAYLFKKVGEGKPVLLGVLVPDAEKSQKYRTNVFVNGYGIYATKLIRRLPEEVKREFYWA